MALERTAALYDKLKRGRTGGLSGKEMENVLIDFDAMDGGSEDDDSEESEEEGKGEEVSFFDFDRAMRIGCDAVLTGLNDN